MVVMAGNQWRDGVGQESKEAEFFPFTCNPFKACVDVSLTALLGFSLAIVFGDQRSWKCMQRVAKNQQHDEMYNFLHSESGLENSIWIHRRKENYEIRWFC